MCWCFTGATGTGVGVKGKEWRRKEKKSSTSWPQLLKGTWLFAWLCDNALREASVEPPHLRTIGKKAGEKANDSSGPPDNQWTPVCLRYVLWLPMQPVESPDTQWVLGSSFSWQVRHATENEGQTGWNGSGVVYYPGQIHWLSENKQTKTWAATGKPYAWNCCRAGNKSTEMKRHVLWPQRNHFWTWWGILLCSPTD